MSINPINIIFNNKDNSDFIQCIFELTIIFKNSPKKIFREISLSKFCKLITTDDNIKYNTIKSFILKITLYRFIKETFIISHDFIENDTNIFKNDDIYIEFTQNNEGLINCCSNLITFDNKMFATPPNY